MLALQIDNRDIEHIFIEGFASNKERFFDFIRQSYQERDSFALFLEDKMRFQDTYKGMTNGTMEILSLEDADTEIENFLQTL